MNAFKLLSLALPILALVASCSREPVKDHVDFATQIKPLLEERCVTCHNSNALFGNLNLENRAFAFRNRPEGAVIVPQKAPESRLYLVLTLRETDRKAMPPTGHRIPAEDVDLIKRWIEQGADWPQGREGVLKIHDITPP
jgi:hypothetical protein